ncbi:helix-turn-helix domain-containing protein [Streptacidiphilus sp. N1-3]|uniref:Helix-turn-helix domain-containing protein n=1 Tax=Streptacidiphilus alkalitolerans TaxID=3342712 RepID=A0ABV6X999_9ACTN
MNWPLETRRRAVAAHRGGQTNADIARTLQVPTGTVSWWVHQERSKHGGLPGPHRSSCHRCDGDELDRPAYAYLLGLYLGDGHIVLPKQHRVPNLSISCSNSWPGLMDAAEVAIRAVLPYNSVCRVRAKGCTGVKVYSKHLPCLFPQHGPGRKHTRPIVLEDWQREIVHAHAWELVRGLIHSDGSRTKNWAQRTVDGVTLRHDYIRYEFTNKSADIRSIYTDALDRLGTRWTASSRRGDVVTISVARRECVASMDEHVGAKY